MELQKKYCKERKIPMFAPFDGNCFSCKRKIEDTDKKHIIGCPYCNRGFCD